MKYAERLRRLLKYRGKALRICHVASMARCGETLLLRMLGAHSRVHIAHNLLSVDSPAEDQLFNYLVGYEGKNISLTNKYISHIDGRDGDVLLLKQGVWQHEHTFDGFILVRNPVSIYTSLKTYDEDGDWSHNAERLVRWMNDMEPSLCENLSRLEPIAQFCLFFNTRMGNLLDTGLPILHYENLVRFPEESLRCVSQWLQLEYEESLIDSHIYYDRDAIGHGKMQLSKEVDDSSIYKYRDIVLPEEFSHICEQTRDVFERYGYDISWDNIDIINKADFIYSEQA